MWVLWVFLYAYPTIPTISGTNCGYSRDCGDSRDKQREIPTFSGTAGPDAGSEGIDRRNTMDGRTLGRTMYFCLFSEKRA